MHADGAVLAQSDAAVLRVPATVRTPKELLVLYWDDEARSARFRELEARFASRKVAAAPKPRAGAPRPRRCWICGHPGLSSKISLFSGQ